MIGLTKVPAVYVRDLSEAQCRAFMSADNKLGDLSSFDMGKLAIEFDFLLKSDNSFSIGNTGFDIVEIDRVLGNDRASSDEDEVELPSEDAMPISRPGDLWLVGKHRILCGGCLDRSNVARLFEGKRASLIVTDPPYGVAIENNVSGLRLLRRET